VKQPYREGQAESGPALFFFIALLLMIILLAVFIVWINVRA